MTRRTSGMPLTGTAALALTDVSGRSRVPRPAARISARNAPSIARGSPEERGFGAEHHVGRVDAAGFPMLQKEAAIGIEDVVGLRSAERRRGGLDALFASLDLDEHPDRGLVDGHDHVVVGELFAVLLVPEPYVQPELFKNLQQDLAVPHERFVLLAELHR